MLSRSKTIEPVLRRRHHSASAKRPVLLHLASYFFFGLAALLPSAVSAQISQPDPDDLTPSIRPVINQSHRDGLLLGADFRLGYLGFDLGIGLAYGFESQATRYRTSFEYVDMIGISNEDWPASLVSGRQGEQGVHISADLLQLYRLVGGDLGEGFIANIIEGSSLRGTGFLGRLWPDPDEDEAPSVRYTHLNALIDWPVIPGLNLQTTAIILLGQSSEDPTKIFQTFTSSSQLNWERVELQIRVGELDNPAALAGLTLNLGLRSYPPNFAGNRFVLATIERSFDLFALRLVNITLIGLLGPDLGWIPVDLRADASIFFEGGVLLNNVDEQKIDQIFFGWGTSLSFPDLSLRIDMAINREGHPRLSIETGLLP